jgi:60S ribosome subunit biogenesis protein NIP7
VTPQHKVWVKGTSELSFLYGNHVLKAGLARMTEDTPQYQGVVVYSLADVPLGALPWPRSHPAGFGVAARSTADTRALGPTDIVVFHQADAGEYLREEDSEFVGGGAAKEGRESGQRKKRRRDDADE